MITVENLSKTYLIPQLHTGFLGQMKNLFARQYRTVHALKDINFNVKEGEIVGLIGANGAGKSTMIKILTGVIHPDKGKVLVNGYIPQEHQRKFLKEIGVVFGQRSQLWWDIGVQDSFYMLKDIYEIDKTDFKKRLEWLAEITEITDILGQPVRMLSLEQRMRCDLVAALLHQPKVVFLDEPTIGLDVNVKLKIRECLKQINQEFNTTIFITSHDLIEIERLCHKIIIIDNGSLYFQGNPMELKQSMSKHRYVKLQLKERINDDIKKKLEEMNCKYNLLNETTIQLTLDQNVHDVNAIIKYFVSLAELKDIVIEEASIEEIVQKLWEKRENQISPVDL